MSRTALGVARLRAQESERPDRLFNDPYAAAFVAAAPAGEPGGAQLPDALRAALRLHVVVRTKFFDEQLMDACAAGCRQVVLLAAGLDTRAFRLPWPAGVRLLELDLPEVLDFKDTVLSGQRARPSCDRCVLGLDLREDWAGRLTSAGLRPDEPTAWLVEGLLIYLTAAEATRVLAGVTAVSAPGSRLAFEHGTAGTSPAGEGPADEGLGPLPANRLTELWKGGLGADVTGWLDAHGWQTQTHDLASLAVSYRRPAPGHARGELVTATRT